MQQSARCLYLHLTFFLYICSLISAECPLGWTEDSTSGLCYGVVNSSDVITSAYAARHVCTSLGADLPDITSVDIKNTLSNLVTAAGGGSVYIGLNDISTRGTWVYDNETTAATYLNWAGTPPGSHVGNNDSCVLMAADGTWTNVDCCSSQGVTFIACMKPNTTNATYTDTDDDVFARHCFQDINECAEGPCQNGATCEDHVLRYECVCAIGYSGTNCSQDSCTPDPCQNSRPCSIGGVGGNLYTCDCGDWYNGTNCENQISQCANNPCENNATCTGDMSDYNCDCLAGFTDKNCQTNIDECANLTCTSNGDCKDGINTAWCECHPGYSGATCDQAISCPSPPTVLNATLSNITTGAAYNYGDVLLYSCISDHKFPDMTVNKTTTCSGGPGADSKGWLPALHHCDLHCESIPSVSNAVVTNGNTRVGNTVNFTCNTGYQFPDNSTHISTTCNTPGEWSTNISDCEVVHCPELPVWPYQELDTRNTSYNTLITFWCDIGYELHDHTTARTIKCLANGEWTADLPPCQPVECPVLDLASIPGNTRNSSANTYDSYVEYQCEPGKRMVDGSTYRVIRCDAMAEWSDNITDCDANRCFPLPYVANATPSALDALFGTTITLTCITGHRFFQGSLRKPSDTMTCHSNGRWDPILSACEPILCPNLTIPAHATLSTDNRLFDTTVNVTCNTGHYWNFTSFEKQRYSRCQEDGTWDVVHTDACQPIPCPDAPDIDNGTRAQVAIGHVYAAEVLYICDLGTKFVDGRTEKNVTCTEFGTWDDLDMSCRKDRCDPVPGADILPDHTQPDTRNTSWYTVVTYTCQPGYTWDVRFPNQSKITEQRTCNNDGTWSAPTVPNCDPKTCPVIEKMANATVNGSDAEADRKFSQIIEYSCDTGYKYADNTTSKTRRCAEDGRWFPAFSAFPVCEIILCPEPEEVSNATRDSNATEYGSTINYECDQGYQYPNKLTSLPVSCTENGTWTELPPPCEVVFCPPVPVWNEAIFNDTNNEFGAVLNYSCKVGFIFEDFEIINNVKVADDEKVSLCLTEKIWDPPIVNCRETVGIADDLVGVTYESPDAVNIGALAITLLSLTGALLLLLDANKLYSDSKVGISNVRMICTLLGCCRNRRKKSSKVSNSETNIQEIQGEPCGESSA